MSECKPDAWLLMDGTIISGYSYNLRKFKEDGDIPLFTQRTWVGLTDEDIDFIDAEITKAGYCQMKFTRAIEAKLKEKNT